VQLSQRMGTAPGAEVASASGGNPFLAAPSWEAASVAAAAADERPDGGAVPSRWGNLLRAMTALGQSCKVRKCRCGIVVWGTQHMPQVLDSTCHRLPAPQSADTKMEDAPEQGDLADAFAAAVAAGGEKRQQQPSQPSGAPSQLESWVRMQPIAVHRHQVRACFQQ
jgi:hypothetical protein